MSDSSPGCSSRRHSGVPEWPRVELRELLRHEMLARYFAGWGRPGDMAMIAATSGEPQVPVGAGWFRRFTEGEPGYGFVNSRIPELGIAVSPAWRGRGAGTAILGQLQEVARVHDLDGLSLSVHPDNPACRMYQRLGFMPVSSTETALTMLWQARPR